MKYREVAEALRRGEVKRRSILLFSYLFYLFDFAVNILKKTERQEEEDVYREVAEALRRGRRNF
jgi:hypothetical protein